MTATLSLDDAPRRAGAGRTRATEVGAEVCIAIVDAGAHLVHFTRMDGAMLGSIDVAMRKARTAVLFPVPTAALGEMTRPGGPAYGLELTNDGLVTIGGGVPITDESGRLVGAVGVSGGSPDQDTDIADAVAAA